MKKSFGFLLILFAVAALGVLFQPSFADAQTFDHRIKVKDTTSSGFIFVPANGDYCPGIPGNQPVAPPLGISPDQDGAKNILRLIYPAKDDSEITELITHEGDREAQGLVTCGRSCDDPTTIINEAKMCELCDLIALPKSIATTLVFVWMPTILGIIIVFAGLLLMTSAGNPDKRKKAIAMIKWAIIGYVIMLSAWIVVNGALSLLGAQGFTDWWNTDC